MTDTFSVKLTEVLLLTKAPSQSPLLKLQQLSQLTAYNNTSWHRGWRHPFMITVGGQIQHWHVSAN